jgi:ABC-type transporter Mla subunit MlaD
VKTFKGEFVEADDTSLQTVLDIYHRCADIREMLVIEETLLQVTLMDQTATEVLEEAREYLDRITQQLPDARTTEVLEEAREYLDRGNPYKPTAIELIAVTGRWRELASTRQEAITHRASGDPIGLEAMRMTIEQIRATLSRLAAALTPPEQTSGGQEDSGC